MTILDIKLSQDYTMSITKTGVFIGRFQPFHEGHKRCVEKILQENDRCTILLRDTSITEKNPFDIAKRKELIRAHFPDISRVDIQVIADPGADLTVYIGRDVGYDLIQLDAQTEQISATDIRRKMYAESTHPS
jgi:adenylylsulfate kinase